MSQTLYKQQKLQEAKEYLTKHNIKQIYTKLVYEISLFRPNDPIQYFIDRLEELKTKGLEDEKIIPKITLVIGPPLSGKTTQLRRLEKEVDVTYLNVDDLIDEGIEKGTEEGKEKLISLLQEKISGKSSHFIIEGFGSSLKEMMMFESRVIEFQHVLHFQLSEKTFYERLNQDENSPKREILEKRFKEYQEKFYPVLEYFKALNKLKELHVHDDDEQVYSDLKKILEYSL